MNAPVANDSPAQEPYYIEREIARCPRHHTYLAKRVESGGSVLIDVLTSGADRDPQWRAQFWLEARVSRDADPRVVVPRTAFLSNGRSHALCDLPAGRTLDVIPMPLPHQTAVAVCLEVARGLASIHRQGYVHGAVRPEGIAAYADAGGAHARLLDVGYCLADGAAQIADIRSHLPIDSLPPDVRAGGRIDALSDVYGVGALLFYTLTGRRLAQSSIQELPADAPLELTALVMQCVSPRRRRRPRGMAQVIQVLEELERKSASATVEVQAHAAAAPPTEARRARTDAGLIDDWFIEDGQPLTDDQLVSLFGYEPEPGASRRSRGTPAWVLGGAAMLLVPAAGLLLYLAVLPGAWL